MCLICFDLAFFFVIDIQLVLICNFIELCNNYAPKRIQYLFCILNEKKFLALIRQKNQFHFFFCFKNHWLFKFHLNKADEEAFFLFALVFFALDSKNKHTTVLVIVYQFLRYFLLFLQKKLY